MKERFKRIREYYSLSQAQFAQKIRMSPGLISNVETGRSRVSEKTIDAICTAFPINRSWLNTGEGGKMFLQGQQENEVDKTTVGTRVREVREWARLTQEEFARRIGYSKVHIHSVEKEKVTPSNQFLEKIAAEFRISSEWLFTGMGMMEAVERGVDEQLINWLNEHPDVIRELRKRSGLD